MNYLRGSHRWVVLRFDLICPGVYDVSPAFIRRCRPFIYYWGVSSCPSENATAESWGSSVAVLPFELRLSWLEITGIKVGSGVLANLYGLGARLGPANA